MKARSHEDAFAFECEGETLVGVVHRPAPRAPPANASLGVVVVVGGPQYRAGSHRQFVRLARALADRGHPVLRFDVRGMGDSGGAPRSFDGISEDVGAAIDALQRVAPEVSRIALWGLCDGASAALMYMAYARDARVVALGLANPWVRSDSSLARTHVKHYYIDRLRQKQFWLKLIRGGLTFQVLRDLLGNLQAAWGASARSDMTQDTRYQTRMLKGWQGFHGKTLLILSGQDYTAKEFVEFARGDAAWTALMRLPNVLVCDLHTADHTFSTAADCLQLERAVCDWLDEGTAPVERDAAVR